MKNIIAALLFFCSSLLFGQDSKEVQELKQKVFATLPTLEGWCSKEQAGAFVDLVLEVKPETCVEIGVFGGSSIYPVAAALKYLGHGVVIGIDPWDKIEAIKYFDPVEDKVNLSWWGKLNFDYIYNSYVKMLKKNEFEKVVLTIKASSEIALFQIKEIDILHIDGNFTEQVSKLDAMLYLPKVRSGGYIWINDALSPTRQEAIDILESECDAVKVIDNGNCILYKKR